MGRKTTVFFTGEAWITGAATGTGGGTGTSAWYYGEYGTRKGNTAATLGGGWYFWYSGVLVESGGGEPAPPTRINKYQTPNEGNTNGNDLHQ